MHALADTSPRLPFRRRLMLTLGPALIAAMILIGVFAWIFFYGWITYNSQSTLDLEIREVAQQVMNNEGALQPERYYWNEPHHRYDTRHIDPYFLQIFDENGYLVRASDNIGLFAPGAYPSRILPYTTSTSSPIKRLRMFEVANRKLYYRTRPIYDDAQQLKGYVQVARYDPGLASIMKRTSVIVLSALVPILMALLGLVWWSARRVVAPLEQITHEAQSISPANLDYRISIPKESDNETVLLADTLNRQLARLEQTFGEMQRFTADAAHELQTPLTILKGHVSVALRRERSVDEYKKTLHLLHDQIEGMIKLSQNLLRLARLEEHEHAPVSEPIDLVSLVCNTTAPFKQRAEEKGIEFLRSLPRAAWIHSNPEMIQEIVTNLCDNAIKYTHEGSIQLEMHVQNEQVTFSIRDTGVGMSPEEVKHATERFYRSTSSNADGIPGSGLGLALVKRFTERLNGTLFIESSPGAGATVTVSFPLTIS